MRIQKRNFVNIRGLRWIIWMMSLTVIITKLFFSTAQAQEKCINALIEAQKLYETGRYVQVIELLNPCLPDSIRDKVRAYRLLALAYLAEEYTDKAEDAVEKLLKQDRTYAPDPINDSPEFIALVSKVKRWLKKPIIKFIKLNVGYPLVLLNNDHIGGGSTAGFEILLGKRFFGGFSYDYLSVDGTESFFLTFMFRPQPALQNRKITSFIMMKFGVTDWNSNYIINYSVPITYTYSSSTHSFTYSFIGGIDIPLTHSWCSNINYSYLRRTFAENQFSIDDPFTHSLKISFSHFFTARKTAKRGSNAVKFHLVVNWGFAFYY